ncbi:MAG: DUF4838 domain-containing protein [Bacteroidota bacterium]
MQGNPFDETNSNAEDHLLIKGGDPLYDILIPSNPPRGVEHAANFLQAELKKLCKCNFAILKQPRSGRGFISLGNTPQARGLTALPKGLGEEGYEIQSKKQAIFIRADHPMGQVNGILAFLEEDLGIRWWGKFPKESQYPVAKPLIASIKSRITKPAFEYREPFYSAIQSKHYIDRNRIRASRGVGRNPVNPWNPYRLYPAGYAQHSFRDLVPGAEFAKSHPEYYSEKNGVRRVPDASNYGTQLCLSNRELAKVVARRAQKVLDEQPHARLIPFPSF